MALAEQLREEVAEYRKFRARGGQQVHKFDYPLLNTADEPESPNRQHRGGY